MASEKINKLKLNFIVNQITSAGSYYGRYARMIRVNSFTNNLKELSVGIKNSLSDDSDSVYKLLMLYKNLKGIKSDSISEIYEAYFDDYKAMCNEANYTPAHSIFDNIAGGINGLIRGINHQIDVLRSTYGISDSHDERFNKTNPKDVINASYALDYCGDIDEDLKKKNLKLEDLSAEDNARIVCKKLNSFKADLLNTFNKTFGDRSVFAELKFSDLIIR